MEEALNLGARSLHLSRDEIMVVSSQQLPQGIRRFEVAPRNSNDRNSLDALLSNVESQMQELDSSSFVKGYSKSDLKEKGLLDSENLGIVRSQYTTPRLLGPFEFFPNIDYMECQELKLHDATWLDSTQSVNPCSSEAQLATIKNSKTDEVTRKFIHPSDTGLLVQLGIGESIIMANNICHRTISRINLVRIRDVLCRDTACIFDPARFFIKSITHFNKKCIILLIC